MFTGSEKMCGFLGFLFFVLLGSFWHCSGPFLFIFVCLVWGWCLSGWVEVG